MGCVFFESQGFIVDVFYGRNSPFKTVESIFIMWRTTGDVKWREREYTIFEAIEKHTRTRYAYTSVEGVDREKIYQLDDMPR